MQQTHYTHNLKKLTRITVCLLIAAVGFSILPTGKVNALSGSDFNAGRIIDDGVFYNQNAMNPQQIQQFLNARVPVCDTNGEKMINSTQTRAQWAQANGKPLPPYICLKDYSQSVSTITNGGSDLCTGSIAGGTKSAGQIIYEVSQACGVNPQVLIVLLQKEQSLVTDDWPWPIQYRSATGYGCPDTAPCDAEFYGYFNQVYQAAKAYKRYRANPNNYNYRAGRNNTILWHPNHGCGTSTVFIENQATAGLYIYTPYRPNQAALNNLYGLGDGCSAYGNRNFWRMFNDWFGSTLSDKPIVNVDWKFENLAGGTDSISPSTNTIGLQPKTISYKGKLYVFYYDATQRVLKLSIDNPGWSHQTLDGNNTANGRIVGDVGKALTAFIYDDTLHIYYYDTTNQSLRHAWYNPANGWIFEVVDGSSGSISNKIANVGMSNIALEYAGGMHVFYYDATNTNLRHAWYTPVTGWKFENLDGDFGSISGFDANTGQNPEAIVYGGTVQLFYYDVSNGNLRHAWSSPTESWKFENLDGDLGSVSGNNNNVGQDPTITIHDGSFQLFYYDITNGNLRHAWASAAQPWKFENLEGDLGSISGYNTNIGSMSRTLSFNNSLYVFYRENSAGIARYAWADSYGWHFANLEGIPYSVSGLTSNTGFWPTIIGYDETLRLYYFDNDQRALRHVFGNPRW